MILRRIGAVVLGLVIPFAIVQIAELGVHVISPPPPNMHGMQAIKAYVAGLPLSALLLVLATWLIGTLLATWTAAKMGRSAVPAYIVGGILLCIGIANAIIIPQPLWFSIATWVIYAGAPFVASKNA